MSTRPRTPPAQGTEPKVIPWARSAILDRAIANLVQRWVGPPLLIALASCQGDPYEPPDRPAFAGAAGVGAQTDPSLPPLPDPLDTFMADLPASGSGFLPIDCKAGAWDPMPYVRPAQSFDYQALQERRAPTAFVMSEAGTACASASDVAACRSALDTLPLPKLDIEPCGLARCTTHAISTTLGDDVQHRMTLPELLAFLGPIDAPEDALVRVFFTGGSLGHGLADACTTAAVRQVSDGFEVYAQNKLAGCNGPVPQRLLLHVSREGEIAVLRRVAAPTGGGCPGRRPEGLREQPVSARDELGAFFARSAQLEAGAVHAFARMIDELRAFDAPAELIAEARAAYADEQRHAEQISAIAARYVAWCAPVHVDAWAPRSRLAMAIENAVEGCVHETWAAVVASYQAARIPDRDSAVTLHAIAADERRHAALSWKVGAWLDARLEPHEQGSVTRAYQIAITELRAQIDLPVSVGLVRDAGLPDPRTAALLFDALCSSVLFGSSRV